MQWLVSLRDPTELPAALAAEVDILDLKDVQQGSLGMPNDATLTAFSQQLQQYAPGRAFSIALGELPEWTADRPVQGLPEHVRWAKLGLSHCGNDRLWIERWQSLRSQLNLAAGRRLDWIAVAYADFESAKSPRPEEILTAAIETNCWGLLVDTYSKSGRSLLDCLGPQRLRQLILRAQSVGLHIALAGQVSVVDLPTLADLRPDILAVRSAVCVNNNRTEPLCPERLAEFRRQLTAALAPRNAATA